MARDAAISACEQPDTAGQCHQPIFIVSTWWKYWSRWIHGRLARAGKDAAQPFAGFVHRGAGFSDDPNPEHEAVIDTEITT